jgi:hypothetical protein
MERRLFSIPVVSVVLVSASLLLAQDAQKPSPVPPPDILGPQLIAWSQLQHPQPVQQAEPSPAQAQPDPSPASQTITGTIVKSSGHYFLKVADGSAAYELDDQDRASHYEGKQVKVAGVLDAKGNSFHIINIELIS